MRGDPGLVVVYGESKAPAADGAGLALRSVWMASAGWLAPGGMQSPWRVRQRATQGNELRICVAAPGQPLCKSWQGLNAVRSPKAAAVAVRFERGTALCGCSTHS